MQGITLWLKHEDTIRRVRTHSFYIGETDKHRGGSQREAASLQASDEDTEHLTEHLRTAAAELTTMLSQYLALCATEEKDQNDNYALRTTTFSMLPPKNYPHKLLSQLERSIEDYATMRILQLWLAQHNRQEQIQADNEVQKASMQMRFLMTQRARPFRDKRKNKKYIEF